MVAGVTSLQSAVLAAPLLRYIIVSWFALIVALPFWSVSEIINVATSPSISVLDARGAIIDNSRSSRNPVSFLFCQMPIALNPCCR